MAAVQQSYGGSPDPESKLQELKQDLDSKKAEANTLTQVVGVLNEDIAVLDQITKEIKQIVDGFGQALKNLKCDKEDANDYLNQKKPKIEDAIKGQKDKLDSKIKELKTEVDAAQAALQKSQSTYGEASGSYEDAKEDAEKAQADYNAAKTYQKSVDDKLKEIKGLRERIEKNENPASKYFLLGELETALKELKTQWIESQEDLKKKLYAAWTDLDAKKEALRKQKKEWEDAKKDVEEKQKKLEQLAKERIEKTLKALSAI
jgi:cingulin